jgi:hypothetical protein
MPKKLATCCWLLLLLVATTTLAQSPSKKKPGRKRPVAQKAASQAVPMRETICGGEFGNDFEKLAPEPFDPNRIYTYGEQMPALNGQSSMTFITTAIRKRLVLPPAAPLGRTFVQFVVTSKGVVTNPRIVKSLRADVDSAVVEATRQLPHFTPGRREGQAVAMSLTLAIQTGAPLVAKPAETSGKK